MKCPWPRHFHPKYMLMTNMWDVSFCGLVRILVQKWFEWSVRPKRHTVSAVHLLFYIYQSKSVSTNIRLINICYCCFMFHIIDVWNETTGTVLCLLPVRVFGQPETVKIYRNTNFSLSLSFPFSLSLFISRSLSLSWFETTKCVGKLSS